MLAARIAVETSVPKLQALTYKNELDTITVNCNNYICVLHLYLMCIQITITVLIIKTQISLYTGLSPPPSHTCSSLTLLSNSTYKPQSKCCSRTIKWHTFSVPVTCMQFPLNGLPKGFRLRESVEH